MSTDTTQTVNSFDGFNESNTEYTNNVSHWHSGGYEYVSDGEDIALVHRLLAYLEEGSKVYEDDLHVHHQLRKNVNTSEWVETVDASTHSQIHAEGGGVWREVDGIPQLQLTIADE